MENEVVLKIFAKITGLAEITLVLNTSWVFPGLISSILVAMLNSVFHLLDCLIPKFIECNSFFHQCLTGQTKLDSSLNSRN